MQIAPSRRARTRALLRLREMALKGDARSLDRLLALAQIFNNGAAIESLGDKAVAARLGIVSKRREGAGGALAGANISPAAPSI
jgi:hypothetical protein